MTPSSHLAALLLLLAAPAAAPGPAWDGMGQLLFHQHIVIRIPRMPIPPGRTPLPPVEWKEKGGPECVTADTLVAATIPTSESVDLMTSDGRRLRARLDKKCRGLDFYAGFYVEAGRDGQVCADRDSIRTRSGDECGIDKFRRLVPAH